jgi:hypothetical protein
MNEPDEIEEMIRLGKVVKIEPMPKSAAPLQKPADSLKSEMTREDRLRIAARIVELSNQVLSTKGNIDYIALKIGSGPNSNVARVRNNRVSFFIRSKDLFNWAVSKGFDPEPLTSTTAANKDKFRFRNLSLRDIEDHEALFREIVKESVGVVIDRRPKEN